MASLTNLSINHEICHYKYQPGEQAELHRLMLFLGKSEIAYLIIQDDRDLVVYLKSYNLPAGISTAAYRNVLRRFMREEAALAGKFKKVSVTSQLSPNTLIPLDFFDDEKLSEYFYFNNKNEQKSNLYYDQMVLLKLANVFSVPVEIEEVLNGFYHQKQKMRHTTSNTLRAVVTHSALTPNNLMHLNFHQHYIEVTVARPNNLLVQNTYSWQTPEDVLYYALNIARYTQFNFEADTCLISGRIEQNDPQWRILAKYFPNIKLSKRPPSYDYCHELDTLPLHAYFHLFSAQF
ncbi:MAG: DUF3822 family protein [Sphingobacteriales bacterium]|jgi:hypothetical protein|nr:DUF3822 family protein [Sphingobacteriales bacterium]MBP9142781.1 DUF3822 family protein [Chitinophagales bacterium]MDA0198402.1 DUF3822 family protein [Bacteroidota bacterium]MBK6891092.1 DUF3822 family protein [Sphingobacteriales bacterium]MBK7527081.1 DUF3822 family protein [Sphingobacteriales bacterium]